MRWAILVISFALGVFAARFACTEDNSAAASGAIAIERASDNSEPPFICIRKTCSCNHGK